MRGTTQWLWNVVTHEFIHMVNIQASQRTPTNVPAIYFQWFDYETERRSDVLTGYPNILVSYPWSGVTVPAWFAEGTAQYMMTDAHHDYWDAHRDMILRTAALDGTILPYDEMSLFAGSLHSEKVYDHGFSLVRYIARQYGEDTLREIIENLRAPLSFSAEGAFRKATGKSGRELYEDWRADLEARARAQAERVAPTEQEGVQFGEEMAGTFNIRPRFSPDGTRLAWISNGGGPFHRGALVVADVDTPDEGEMMAGSVAGGFSWAPDGDRIYYATRREKDRFGSLYFDLHELDLEAEESERLTRGARLRDPEVSPDGTRLAAVHNQDGTNQIVLVDLPIEDESPSITVVTESPFGRQYFAPRWTADGNALIIDMFESGGELDQNITRDVARIAVDGPLPAEPEVIFSSPADDRMPVVDPAGGIVFASDSPTSGINKFDLYHLDPASGDVHRLTNVMGGAFYPDVSPTGDRIAFANFTADGYKIHVIDRDAMLREPVGRFQPLPRESSNRVLASVDFSNPEPYRGRFTRFHLSPRLFIDEGEIKVGTYASTRDVLERQSIFGGAAYALTNGDFDLFAIYENRMFWPTFFAEAFWIRKNREEQTEGKLEGLNRTWDLDLRYDALQVDAGLRLEFGSPFSPFAYQELSARYRYSKSHLDLTVTKLDPVGDLLGDGEFLILPRDGWDYYRGRDIVVSYTSRNNARELDAEINPVGREIGLTYTYSQNDLSPSGERDVNEAGIVTTVFEDNTFHQVDGRYRQSFRLPGGQPTLDIDTRGGWISQRVDDFFWFRVGSRPGLRGYTYYSLEGQAFGMGRATFRFPILPKINKRLLQFHFQRLYGGLFYEAGLIWERPIWSEVRKQKLARDLIRDVGFELRMDMVNFYTFPARLSIEGAYPLDRVPIPSTIAGEDGEARTDRDWKFYFGLLFGY